MEEGTNIYWKFSRVENLPTYLSSLSLPKDIGSGIVIDLTRNLQNTSGSVNPSSPNVGTSEADDPQSEAYLTKTCLMLKHFLLHHLGSELQRSPHFRGIFIFPTINDVDQMKVIRICFGFKRTISLDNYLKMIGVPYGTDDIVNHCYGEISCNTHIIEIFENAYTAFDTFFFLNVRILPRSG
jgi:hypothetical protein